MAQNQRIFYDKIQVRNVPETSENVSYVFLEIPSQAMGAVPMQNSEQNKNWCKLQALAPPTTATTEYTIGLEKLSANGQFFCWCSNGRKFAQTKRFPCFWRHPARPRVQCPCEILSGTATDAQVTIGRHKSQCKLQAQLVYDILSSTPAITEYTIGFEKLSAKSSPPPFLHHASHPLLPRKIPEQK